MTVLHDLTNHRRRCICFCMNVQHVFRINDTDTTCHSGCRICTHHHNRCKNADCTTKQLSAFSVHSYLHKSYSASPAILPVKFRSFCGTLLVTELFQLLQTY